MPAIEPQAMEEYIPLHLKRYESLVGHFANTTAKKALVDKSKGKLADEQSINPDIFVVARVRPLLEVEINSGFPQSVFCRPNTAGLLDVHDLKRPVRGPPALPTLQVSLATILVVRGQHFSPRSYAHHVIVRPLSSRWIGHLALSPRLIPFMKTT